MFVFCHIRGCRLRSPFFCSSLECTVLLTSSCSTRARWIKEVLVRQCFAFALCYAPQASLAMFGRSTNFLTVAAHTPYTWPLPAVQGKMVLTRQSFKSQGSFWPSCNKGYVIYTVPFQRYRYIIKTILQFIFCNVWFLVKMRLVPTVQAETPKP